MSSRTIVGYRDGVENGTSVKYRIFRDEVGQEWEERVGKEEAGQWSANWQERAEEADRINKERMARIQQEEF